MTAPAHVQRLLDRLERVHKNGAGWSARCPSHDDKSPSLSINVTDEGKLLLKCFGGCSFEQILAALQLESRDLWPPQNGPRYEARTASNRAPRVFTTFADAQAAACPRGSKLIASWAYRSAQGEELFWVCRYEPIEPPPPGEKPKKTFRPIRSESSGFAIADPPGPLPLYRLPKLIASPPATVYICEGEKAADALANLDLVSTTTAHGAQSPNKTDLAPLAGRNVVILPDNDDPGEKYASNLIELLGSLAPQLAIRILRLPDLPPSGDAVEFITDRKCKGRSDAEIRAEIEQLAAAAPPTTLNENATASTTLAGDAGNAAAAPADFSFEVTDADLVPAACGRRCEDLRTHLAKSNDWKPAFDAKNLVAAAVVREVEPRLYAELCERLRTLRQLGTWKEAVATVARRVERAMHAQRHHDDLPTIQTHDAQLRDLTADTTEAIYGANDRAPSLYVRNNSLVRLIKRTKGYVIELVTPNALFGFLGRIANWFGMSRLGPVAVKPDRDVVAVLIEDPPPKLPPLESIVTAPIYTATGELLNRVGYHSEHATYFSEIDSIVVPDVPTAPTNNEVKAAIDVLLNDLLVDFPFATPADAAMAVGALVLPFVRRLVHGPTPIHVLEASSPGSGKTLFCNLHSIIVTGDSVAVRTLPTDESEMRKKITTELMRSPQVILFDNAAQNKLIDSAVLSAVTTSDVWEDRALHFNKNVVVSILCQWFISANNPRLSPELARRSIRIRIQPHSDRPWERTKFRHPRIAEWTREHRQELIRAILILVNHWIALGRPAGTRTLGSFESWASVIGGILEAAGIASFLENQSELYETADADSTEWRALTVAWVERYGHRPVSVGELVELCAEKELLADLLGDGIERSRTTRLGYKLRQLRGRVFGTLQIEIVSDSGKRGRTYRVVRVNQDEPPPPAAEASDGSPSSATVHPEAAPAADAEGAAVRGGDVGDLADQGPPSMFGDSPGDGDVGDLGGPFSDPSRDAEIGGSGAARTTPRAGGGVDDLVLAAFDVRLEKVPQGPHPHATNDLTDFKTTSCDVGPCGIEGPLDAPTSSKRSPARRAPKQCLVCGCPDFVELQDGSFGCADCPRDAATAVAP